MKRLISIVAGLVVSVSNVMASAEMNIERTCVIKCHATLHSGTRTNGLS